MKFLKIVFITLISIVGIVFIWFNLPVEILFRSEISSGNEFVKNVLEYRKLNGNLPEENQLEILEKLNPRKPYEDWYPAYRKLDKDNFELIYFRGFDPPYLQYDTKTKKWEKRFPTFPEKTLK